MTDSDTIGPIVLVVLPAIAIGAAAAIDTGYQRRPDAATRTRAPCLIRKVDRRSRFSAEGTTQSHCPRLKGWVVCCRFTTMRGALV